MYWYPATVYCNERHVWRFDCCKKASDYTWWPEIDALLYIIAQHHGVKVKQSPHGHFSMASSHCILRVVNKTRNGTEWNGMEKVNKTRNGTAESAQSTPTHPWPTELHPRKLFVHAERLLTRLAGNGCMVRQADYSFHSTSHNLL